MENLREKAKTITDQNWLKTFKAVSYCRDKDRYENLNTIDSMALMALVYLLEENDKVSDMEVEVSQTLVSKLINMN